MAALRVITSDLSRSELCLASAARLLAATTCPRVLSSTQKQCASHLCFERFYSILHIDHAYHMIIRRLLHTSKSRAQTPAAVRMTSSCLSLAFNLFSRVFTCVRIYTNTLFSCRFSLESSMATNGNQWQPIATSNWPPVAVSARLLSASICWPNCCSIWWLDTWSGSTPWFTAAV